MMVDMQQEVLRRNRLHNSRPRDTHVHTRDTIKYTAVSTTCASELEQCLNVIPISICVGRTRRKFVYNKVEPETKTFLSNQTRSNKAGYNTRTLSPRCAEDGQSGAGTGQFGVGSGQLGAGSGQSGAGSGQFGAGTGQSGTGSGQFGAGSGQLGAGSGQSGAGSGQFGAGSSRNIARTQNTRQTGEWKVNFENIENTARHRVLISKHVDVSNVRATRESIGFTSRAPVNQVCSKRLSGKGSDKTLIKHKVTSLEARDVITPVVETLTTAGKRRGNTRRKIFQNLTAAMCHKGHSAAKTSNNDSHTPRPKVSIYRCKTSMGFSIEPEQRAARTTKSAGFIRYRQGTAAEGSILTESCITNLSTRLEAFVTENNIYKFEAVFLSCDPDTRQKVVGHKAGGSNSSSVFFRACQLSRLAFVSLMLEECAVELEQTGVFQVPDDDDGTVFQVTPLWQAAASCNLDLVRLLTSFGANINATSTTGCTVVRAACCVASVAVVSYLIAHGADIHVQNEYGVTCLMNAITSTEITKLLIHHGSKISQTDVQGNTVLHYAIETGRLDTVKLLVEMGANPMTSNNDNCDAIRCAATHGHRDVVDYLLKVSAPSLAEIVDTLLLLGSVCIIMDHDYYKGYLDWHRAFQLKRLGNTVSRPHFRTPGFGDNFCPSVLTDIVDVKEIKAVDELTINYCDHERLILQALLIYERIRGALDNNFLHLLMYRGAVSADEKNFRLAINLWKTAYKLRLLKCVNTSGRSDCVDMFNNSIMNTLRLLVKILHEVYQEHVKLLIDRCNEKENISVSEDIIRDLFRTACHHVLRANEALKQNKTEDKRLHGSFTFLLKACLSICYVYLKTVTVVTRNPEVLIQLQKLIRLNTRGVNNETLLHICLDCQLPQPYHLDAKKLALSMHPSFVLMELLLLLGADPLAQDAGGNTVLHVAARLHSQGRTLDLEQVKMMLRLGVHADQVNHRAETALHFIPPVDDLRSILQQTALKCLAARVIVLHKISYIGEIPKSLYSFIELHGS